MPERIENLQQAIGKIVLCTDGVRRKITQKFVRVSYDVLFAQSLDEADTLNLDEEFLKQKFIGGTVVESWEGGAE